MIRLGVLFGGKSGEHEVSLMSASSILRAIDRTKYTPVMIGITRDGEWLLYEGDIDDIEKDKWEESASPFKVDDLKSMIDFALPILHGTYGEDGTVQGLFEMLDIPYAGCGVLASSAAMDKLVSKSLFINEGLPICKYEGIIMSQFDESQAAGIAERLGGYPCFVKPANLGSSVGVSKASNEKELICGIYEAGKFDRRVIVEEGMNIREVETAVIGNDEPIAAVVGEIIPSAEFYDYTAKYFDGGQSKLIIPADLPKETSEKIREYAVRAYKTLDCAGFARVDFFVTKDKGEIYINEINTIPGFTKFSMFSALFKAAGIDYPHVIERIVDYGYERYNIKNSRKTNI